MRHRQGPRGVERTRHVFAYADGEVRQEFSVCFLARPTMVPGIRKRVDDWREGNMPAAR
ncbi:hypothetical protein [Streptomyces murinus]|uniref:hypothetical protein n=1 Tax=Streptomyces murinus TaxID=33900 RepID=UPI0036E4AE27